MLEVASQMASAMDCYEDMFKEITRKLYGEEEDVDFEAEGFKSVEHLTAAFGLATRSHLKSETPAAQQPKPSPTSEQESPNPPQVNTPTATKRYNCTHCPYATDRRDLFTRHENIHREDKPFQCYVCMKQFNRADHVKKHFLRMHREHTYDLNRIRKQPPKNASGMSFYHKYNESQPLSNNIQQSVQNHQQQINIPSGIVNPNVRNNQTPIEAPKQQPKTNSNSPNKSSSSSKKKGEKKFSCCYCTWTGVDNWCLKRHLNTHLKPFVCMLCDYKAARSERLTTHILKVHNKRACTRCNFLADDQAALTIHLQENHPLDHRNNRNVHNRNNQNNNTSTNTANTTAATMSSAFGQLDPMKPCPKIETPSKHKRQSHGADRLFSYLEASDHESNPEDESHNTNKQQQQQQQQQQQSSNNRPQFTPEKIPNPPPQTLPFKQDPKKMGDFSKMFFNNQFLGESSKYIPDPNIMKNMQVNYFSDQNLVFNKFLDEEKNLYYQNLPDSKNMFLNHPNFGTPTPNPFFNPQYIQDKAKSAALMGHPSVSDVTKMYKHPDFFKAGNVTTQDEEDIELPLFICTTCGCEFMDDSSLEHHNIVSHNKESKIVIDCRTFPAKKICIENKIDNCDRRTERGDGADAKATPKDGAVETDVSKKTRVYVSKAFVKKMLPTSGDETSQRDDASSDNNFRMPYTCKICTNQICINYRNRFKKKLKVIKKLLKKKCATKPADKHEKDENKCLSIDDKYNNNSNNNNNNNTTTTNTNCLKENKNEHNISAFDNDNAELKNDYKKSQLVEKKDHRPETIEPEIITKTDDHNVDKKADSPLAALKNKYLHKLLKIQKCIFCRTRHGMKVFWSKVSLNQHNLLYHSTPFQCEHCPVKFKHRYQVVLHCNKEHV